MTEPARLRGERTAAVVLLAAGPGAALAVLAVCVVAVVLVPAGLWRPVVVAPVLLPAGALAWRLGRWIPVRRGPPVPVWSAVACVLVAVGFVVWAAATHGEHLVLRRDAGSYALYAHWLATRHGLPVSADLPAFGGQAALSVPGFTLDSPAFYQVLTTGGGGVGARIDPQFLIGAPALDSIGWWLDGWTGLFAVPAVLSGLAVLTAGSVTARVVGPRWAPLGAAGLALTQPMLHAARTTFSEPAATLLVLGAAALAVDALELPAAERRPVRRLALLAGALLGLAGLVRIDAVREVALLVPVCALLWIRRHPAAVPLGGAAVLGVGAAMIPAAWLARPYLHTVSGSLVPLLEGTAGLCVLSLAVVAAHRWWEGRRPAARVGGPARWGGRLRALLPAATGGGVVLVGAALASRPLWTTARQAVTDPGDALVASLQRQQGLPVDGARTYAEQSAAWVAWYTGVPAVAAALLALAAAAALAVRWWLRSAPTGATPTGATATTAPAPAPAPGTAAAAATVDDDAPAADVPAPPRWLVPALVGLGSTVLTLYRPGITPDHPWADRRLVTVVLPVVMIAATAAAAWGVRQARRRMPVGLLAVGVAVACLAVVLPPWLGTRALATVRTEIGEPAAVAAVCGQLRPGDVVVGVSDAEGRIRAQDEWVQVVRGVCGHPSAALRGRTAGRESVDRLGALAKAAGHRLVLLSAAEDDGSAQRALASLGLSPARAVLLHTTEDQHLLTRRPFDRDGLVIDVWLAVWR